MVAEIETCSVECKANVLSLLCYVFSLIHTFCVCLLALLYVVELRQAVPKSSLPGMQFWRSHQWFQPANHTLMAHRTVIPSHPFHFRTLRGTYTLNVFSSRPDFHAAKGKSQLPKRLVSMLHIKLHLPSLLNFVP